MSLETAQARTTYPAEVTWRRPININQAVTVPGLFGQT